MIQSYNTLLKLDWNILDKYIGNNIIVANKHIEYDIWILNYSPKVQSKQLWDDYTISCRGMVVDSEGNILARPFKKFKNYEEYDPRDIDFSQKFEAFEKMDGSLIILFYYEKYKEWIISSRGSFYSEQSKEASKMFDRTNFKHLNKGYTYLFEVIYPENRIVVDYGSMRDLVLLGAVETSSGYEILHEDLYGYYSKYFTIVEKIPVKTFKDLKELRDKNDENREGFVIRFDNGFRIKMKLDEYIRLHAIVTNVSNLTVWEHLKDGYDFDELIDRVPDEFYSWVKKTIRELRTQYFDIERQAFKEFYRIYHEYNLTERKEFANEAKLSEFISILFALYDCREYSDMIWKRIRPIYSKPFQSGYDIYS